jgi:hypothetical protein
MNTNRGSFHRLSFRHSAVLIAFGFLALSVGACERPSFTHDDPQAAAKLAVVATNDIGKSPELQQTAMTLGASIYAAACKGCTAPI